MATRRRATSLFVVLLGLGTALLSGDAIPQGYQLRHRRDHRCPTCPRDCSENLAGGQAEPVKVYTPAQVAAQPQYAAPAQPSYSPHPSPASYVTPPPQPQPQYSAPSAQPQPQYSAPPAMQPYQPIQQQTYAPQIPPACNCPPNFNPYNYPDSYGYDCGCRCGRSVDTDEDYAMFSKYNRRSLDENKQYSQDSLPFADESSPPANFYKNYRPYVRDQSDRHDYESEEQPSRRSLNSERERVFVVYRADASEEKPSDSELESVIKQSMDVARQQQTQEDFAVKARKAKSANRYRYEHQNYQDAEGIDFKALKEDIDEDVETRFNLSPGPLMNIDETYIAEEGDDKLNPGLDQSNWTIVPSLSDLELDKPQESEAIEEIEAAVSVVTDTPKMKLIKVPKIMQKTVGDREKIKKETIEVVRADEIEKKSEIATDLIEDLMQTPSIVTEATNFEGPVESSVTSVPTTYASVP